MSVVLLSKLPLLHVHLPSHHVHRFMMQITMISLDASRFLPLLLRPPRNLLNYSIQTQTLSLSAEQQSQNNYLTYPLHNHPGTPTPVSSSITARTILFVSLSSPVLIVIVPLLLQNLLATISLPLQLLPTPILSPLPRLLFLQLQTVRPPRLPSSIDMAPAEVEAMKAATTSFQYSSRSSTAPSPIWKLKSRWRMLRIKMTLQQV